MTQPSLTQKQQVDLAEMLELAQLTEKQAKELCELATAIDKKWQLRLDGRATVKQQAHQE